MNETFLKLRKLKGINLEKFLIYINYFSLIILIYVIFRLLFIAFFQNSYELLFTDERIIINDIYNVWNLDNEFDRYGNVNNQALKNVLLIITEIVYGGDLRYGRIWSNIFIFLLGPFSLLNDQVLITAVRVFTIFIYFISINLLINLFLDKNLKWFYLLVFYSIPGAFYFNIVPKPDPFVILFIAFAFLAIKKENFNWALFLLGVATGVKIVGIFALALVIVYLILTNKIKVKISSFFKILLLPWLGLIFANPILIIPPLNIGSLPNFYKIYYNWINSQSLYGQEERFNFNYLTLWSDSISLQFSFNLLKNSFFIFFLMVIVLYVTLQLAKNKQYLILTVITIGISHLLFIFLSVERQWLMYLNFSFIFIFIGLIYFITNTSKRKHLLIIFLFFTVIPTGVYNLNDSFSTKNLEDTTDIQDIELVISKINTFYKSKSNSLNIVYWDPKYGMARNNVTYIGSFKIKEHWEYKNLNDTLQKSDFYVTKVSISNNDFLFDTAGEYFIYYRNN